VDGKAMLKMQSSAPLNPAPAGRRSGAFLAARRRGRCRATSILTALIVLGLAMAAIPAGADDGWQPLVEGIDYREYALPGPNRAYVARLDRAREDLIIDSGIALGEIGAGKETVSQMAPRYDQALNAWGGTWGSRNQVVVAINGSFYNTSTGVPESGVVHSGVYTKWYASLGGGSGFAWTLDRQAFIGQCVYHRPENVSPLSPTTQPSMVSMSRARRTISSCSPPTPGSHPASASAASTCWSRWSGLS
jgi:hypothetical protein